MKIAILSGIIVLACFFSGCVVQAAGFRGAISMNPTFEDYDVALLYRTKFLFESPQRNDVVVATEKEEIRREMPKDRFVRLIHPIYWDKHTYRIAYQISTNVKRVIGLPGETIEIIDKQVYINGEKHLHSAVQFIDPGIFYIEHEFGARDNLGPLIVPDEHYFILGDNRDVSRDSREFGFVHISDIKGKVPLLIYSRRDGKIRWFKKVE